jgi:hypothetical protein
MNAPLHVIHADWQEVLPLDDDDLEQIAYLVGKDIAPEIQDLLRMRRDKDVDPIVRRRIHNLYLKLTQKWEEQ